MNTLDDELDIPPWQAPEVIDGRYRVIRKVGRGGFADVYLAEHVNVPGLLVAIKVLLSHRSDDPGLVARFKREAVALASLRSRHTVRIHDLGVVDDLPYLVMEFLENVPLSSVLDMQGRIARGQAAIVAIGVLKALMEAHAAGIVHRDLKPDNILLTLEPGERHPVPRVIDFGIAKLLATPSRASSGTTTAGNVRFCTPEYAAPEVLEGQPGYQSDLYSLGHTLAELVDGKPPYAARTVIAAAAMHLVRIRCPWASTPRTGPWDGSSAVPAPSSSASATRTPRRCSPTSSGPWPSSRRRRGAPSRCRSVPGSPCAPTSCASQRPSAIARRHRAGTSKRSPSARALPSVSTTP